MCTYLTLTTDVAGSARDGEDWFAAERAVVYYDHPQDAPLEHALCVDIVGARPGRRAAVELDAASARRLAQTILAVLDDAEARELVGA